MLTSDLPVAVYMEGAVGQPFGKMGYGVLRYSPNPVICLVDSNTAGTDARDLTGIDRSCPIVASVGEAAEQGAKVLILGIATPGGALPDEWYSALDEAVSLGMSLVNGLHTRLASRYPSLGPGQFVWDVRVEPEGLWIGTGAAASLTNRRVLMIGTDMSVGKMTAGLEILKSARAAGIKTEFVATGQIGMVVTGGGVPLDGIRLDFASGAIEREVIARKDADLIVIEGQGALIHPASTANLPLLRGSCPTHVVLCHRAGQQGLIRLPHIVIPPLDEYVELYGNLASACGTFPTPQFAGVALNTSHLKTDRDASEACEGIEHELGVACVDPVRHGAHRLVEALI